MANLYIQNDMNLTLDGMRFDADQSVINDAVLTAHFFDAAATGKITGATNATPIVITSAAHGLTTGQQVVIAHVTGNPAANGCWTITVIDADTFSLNTSVGNGAYNRGGDWYKAVTNGTNLSMVYQAGTNGRYIAVIPFTIDRLAGESSRLIIFCANYNYQIERDHLSVIRT